MKQKIKKIVNKAGVRLDLHRSDKKIRTVAVCAAQVPFFSGGAETHVASLIFHLREKGYEVELINIPYKWYPHEQLLKSIEIWKMLDLSESNGKKVDLVIATKFPSYFINHHNKVLWLIHQYRQIYDLFNTPYSGFDQKSRRDMELRDSLIKMDNLAFASYKRIYTNAKNTALRLQKYNSVTGTPLYHPPKLAGRYYSSESKDYILSVGRLDKLKRIDLLLQALKYCSVNIRCKIAGTGPEQENLHALAERLGIADRVDFLGFVPDEQLLRLYAEAGAVFFAPLDEDYGYITLEAFLSKKPVITGFDSGGPLEFVENERNGIVLQSYEPEKTARVIEGLLFNKEKCAALGTAGYDIVKTINWDFVINCLLHGK